MLELLTFGGLELRTEAGERVEALSGRTKCLALLAYLAVEGTDGRVPREEVAYLLWPDRPDDRARNSLRVALSHVRKATERPLVGGEGEASLWFVRDHLRADVTAFREALAAGERARALELYRGDFLAGVRVPEAGPFLRWADERRGRFRREAYEAALEQGSESVESGDLASAEESFRTALDLAPLREEAAERLIRTLADRGRAADAVQLYEAFRRRRREELDLAPSDELREVIRQVRRSRTPASLAGEDAEDGETAEPARATVEEAGGAYRAAGPAKGEGAAEVPSGALPADPPAGATGGDRTGRRRLRRGFVAVTLLGAVLAGAWHLVGSGSGPEGAGDDRSIAVLPFETLGDEEGASVLAEGMHSDLLTRLSHVSGIRVVSSTSVERYRDTELPLPAVAESLGARWVVEGAVQRAGGDIQVNAQLIDSRTDAHAWAETYRRELTAEGLFDLQGDITRRIARSLETELTSMEQERVERRPTDDLEAYRLYVRGRRRLNRRTGDDARAAVRHFRSAIERDSGYALAWSGLADAVDLAGEYGWALPDVPLPEPEEAARQALELAPDLAEARATLGRLLMDPWGRRDAPAAFRELQRAVELNPSYAQAHHWLGYLQLALGDMDRAVDHLTLAVELDPGLHPARAVLGWAHLARGEPGEAMAQIQRAAAAGGGVPEGGPTYARRLRDRAIVLHHQGRYAEAERLARRGISGLDDVPYMLRTLLVATEVALGDVPGAREELARMRQDDLPPVPLGLAHAALGDVDAAFDAFLGDEVIWPPGTVVALRYWFPEALRRIRADPRYPELVREIERKWKLEPDGTFGGLGRSS